MAKEVGMEFAFFEFLRSFYVDNRGIIRNRYREITKKYLDYNDKEKNPDAFLRTPQFEALEMYVFVKEFMNKLDIENPIIRINTAFKGCSSLEKISVLPRIYHN